MTINVFPVDAVDTDGNATPDSPTYTGEMTRQFLSALMGYAPPSRPLGTNSGVRPGTPALTVSVSGSTYSVAPHGGIVDAETSATAGAYLYAISAAETGTVQPASSAGDRIDLVSVQISDPAEGDGSSVPSAVVTYTQGNASSGAVPATPARSLALAQVKVPKTGTGSPVVTWVATPWDDTGWLTGVTGIVSGGPGCGMNSYAIRRIGNRVRISAVYRSAAITVTANGDIGNRTVMVVNDPRFIPASYQPVPNGGSGPMATFQFAPDGSIQLCAVSAGAPNIATNDVYSVAGEYWID